MFVGSNSNFLIENLLKIPNYSMPSNMLLQIIFEIKKTLNELMGILERSKKEKIVWNENSRIVCGILIKKKTIQRNIKSLFIYFFHRFKTLEMFFWTNNFNFSKKALEKFFSKYEFKFLNLYNQILIDYFDQMHFNLFINGNHPLENPFSEIFIKENLNIIFKKKKKKFFNKNSKLFMNLIEIEGFITNQFFFKI